MSFFESFYFPVLIFSVVCYWAIPSSKVKKFSLFFFSFFLFSITKFPFMLGLFLQTVFIYLINQKLKKNKKIAILSFALIIPLSILIVFKYLPPLLDWKGIILPIGISYFTFKHIHYCIEMYRDNTAEGDFLTYLSYIYFLPIFIAGPIERWNNYCSQIQNIQFKQQDLSTGMELILTGCIKKLVISDILLNSFLPETTQIAENIDYLSWYQLFLICFLKLLITYADFSGYSDIAIGSARLFGIKIMENFNYPLLRSNLTDFWKNWHISLSSWVKDYIYYPLLIKYKILWLAIIATMVIMGLWHQGNFNWFSWGLHHSLGLIIYSAIRKYFSNKSINFKFNSNKIIKQAHYLTGVLTVWWFVSLAYALTMFPDDFSRSFKLYIKILSFGVINA